MLKVVEAARGVRESAGGGPKYGPKTFKARNLPGSSMKAWTLKP